MGRNSLLAKIDIKAAYRLVPVCPTDRMWLGMCWSEQVYVCICHVHSVPKIFNAVADALNGALQNQVYNVLPLFR